MAEPRYLNETLYRLLKIHFGQVDVVNEGQALVWDDPARSIRARQMTLTKEDGSPVRYRLVSGEEYRVTCPFCNDTRGRLYINHKWGVYDPDMDAVNLWLCQCWNEQCMADHWRRVQLHEWVFGPAPQCRNGRYPVHEGNRSASQICEVEMPGYLTPLEELVVRQPHHPAVEFLQDRGFDPAFLSRRYGVAYCADSHYSLASNRIIIPVVQDGKLVGWQARYIGDPPKGAAKYWTCPGMAKRLLAYNRECAARHHTVVFVEGPTDVWRFGPQAMGLFGKTMHEQLARSLETELMTTNSGEHTLVILLDPKQDEKEQEKGRDHHIEKLRKRWVAVQHELGWPVLPVYLPEDMDPGSADRGWLRRRIVKEGRKQGIEVRFTRPVA